MEFRYRVPKEYEASRITTDYTESDNIFASFRVSVRYRKTHAHDPRYERAVPAVTIATRVPVPHFLKHE
jgi:hypothetical protein